MTKSFPQSLFQQTRFGDFNGNIIGQNCMQKCVFANHCIIIMDFVTKEGTELKSRPLYNLLAASEAEADFHRELTTTTS